MEPWNGPVRGTVAARTALALDAYVVPPRFADAHFSTYRPDPRFPSQAIAREHVATAVAELTARGVERRGIVARLRQRPGVGWQGLYLDGGFGVGKTHLLAAAWHASAGVARVYLSFQELTYVVGALGMARTLDVLGSAALVCLDEFELDDPGNTMLAVSFVRGALDRGARVIATSNTLPEELGRGRFNADDFAREIGRLAASFATVRIDGEDYRHRRYERSGPPARLLGPGGVPVDARLTPVDWRDFLAELASVHPVRYASMAAALAGVWLRDVAPLPDQDTALRFVHFADKLYDHRVPLAISGGVTLDALFPSTIGYGPFERKFRRCRSRLYEMLSEPIAMTEVAAADD